MTDPEIDERTKELIRMAVREDLGTGDKTVELAIPADLHGLGTIVSREYGVICGVHLLEPILREYGSDVTCELERRNGDRVLEGARVARLRGSVRTILSAERVILNFLGRMSGVANLTARYVEAIEGTKAVIVDTRKTVPGWRALDKFAVRCGGGVNHRMGLYDGVMLKDNHLAALKKQLGSGVTLAELTRRVRENLPKEITLWLEVDTLEQLSEAFGGGAEIILLDNFSMPELLAAVGMRNMLGHKELLEASGGITLDNVRLMAKSGVDRISIGALTHSARVMDLSMEFE